MNRYLYTTAGAVIGYFDQDRKYLYTTAGKVIAYFDDHPLVNHAFEAHTENRFKGYLSCADLVPHRTARRVPDGSRGVRQLSGSEPKLSVIIYQDKGGSAKRPH